MKFKYGQAWNEAGETREVKVKGSVINWKHLVFGATYIAIGVYSIAAGAFKNGVESLEKAQYEALDDLGLLSEVEDSKIKVNEHDI